MIFGSGAKSSEAKPRYDLLPVEGVRRGAQRMTEGASAHGERNFERGVDDAAFVRDRENHLIEHALLYAAGDRSTDHLGAVIANACMLARLEAIRDSRITMTYDEDLCHPVTCHCGRKVTHGPCKMASADQCPFGPRADSTGHP